MQQIYKLEKKMHVIDYKIKCIWKQMSHFLLSKNFSLTKLQFHYKKLFLQSLLHHNF